MSRQEILPKRSVRSQLNYNAESEENDSTWSHEDVVAHRLASGPKTLDSVKTPIESSLGEYFDKKSNKEWAVVVKKLAQHLPHGYYILKPELYGILKPELYPFEIEADRDFVVSTVKEYQQAAQLQELVRKPRNKRSIVMDSDDEEEIPIAAKRVKVDPEAHKAKAVADDTTSEQSQSQPSHSLDIVCIRSNLDFSPDKSEVIDLDPESEHDLEMLESSSKTARKSSLENNIMYLMKNKSKLQELIKDVDVLKSTALHLRQKISKSKKAKRNFFEKSWGKRNDEQSFIQEKDKQIKQLRYSLSEKDRRLSSLEENLRGANAIVQSLTSASRALQSQQQLSEREAQIRQLSFELAQEKHLRAKLQKFAKETDQKYQYLLGRSGAEYQRTLGVQKQLGNAEREVRAAWLREEETLVEDENKLLERRAEMARIRTSKN